MKRSTLAGALLLTACTALAAQKPLTVQAAANVIYAYKNAEASGPVGPVTAAATAVENTVSAVSAEAAAAVSDIIRTGNGYKNGDAIGLSSAWKYADMSAIHTGNAVMYTASSNRKNKIVAVNAGHGTKGGTSVKTYCHPDKTAKITGGTTSAGALQAVAVSTGMTFNDGTPEAKVTLQLAELLKEKLLSEGYDVLMLRDGDDVQLDNVARTIIANNAADIHIAVHWDGDGLSSDKGAFYMSVPEKLRTMSPVNKTWQQSEKLGACLLDGLKAQNLKIWKTNALPTDLTQTSYSTIPSIDIELGNQCSDHSAATLKSQAAGLAAGVNAYFGF